MVNKEIIRKDFSKYAKYYDQYSTIQNLCAAKLINQVKKNNFRKILDIGCGTGNYTGFLRSKFPGAEIKAVDMSEEMIRVARKKLREKNIKFGIADAEDLNLKGQFDLISSNAAFQWFGNLEKTLFSYKKLLSKDGFIIFSIFGPLTFHELNTALKKFFGQAARPGAGDFMKKAEIERILGIFFNEIKVKEEIFKERHISLSGLLKKIKYTGTRGGRAAGGKLWTSKTVSKIEKIYKKEFKDIVATYQVFFCGGQN